MTVYSECFLPKVEELEVAGVAAAAAGGAAAGGGEQGGTGRSEIESGMTGMSLRGKRFPFNNHVAATGRRWRWRKVPSAVPSQSKSNLVQELADTVAHQCHTFYLRDGR